MIIAIDIESTGLSPWKDKLLGISIATDKEATYYRWGGRDGVFPWPYDILKDPNVTKVGHNLRFDLRFLSVNGVEVSGPWHDTKLISHLLNENEPHGLKPLAKKYLGPDCLRYATELKNYLAKAGLKMSDLGNPLIDQHLVAKYCCEDTTNTLKLFHYMAPRLQEYTKMWEYYTQEMLPLEKVLLAMELRGNVIDTTLLERAENELLRRQEDGTRELEDLLDYEIQQVRLWKWEKDKSKYKTDKRKALSPIPPFNWSSGDQKRELFYTHLHLGQYCNELTKAGNPTLEAKVIEKLKLPEGKLKKSLDTQSRLNRVSRMLSAYVIGVKDRLVDGVIHGEYNQASREETGNVYTSEGGTVTGRLSHSNPNLGNLPRKTEDYWEGTWVKDLFLPTPGHVFIYADYSQIELRVATHLSQDRKFIEVFNDGGDPHQQTADDLRRFGVTVTRQEAKTINFLMIYMGSPWRLCKQLGTDPDDPVEYDKAERIISGFFEAHPQLRQWIFEIRQHVKKFGFVDSMYGKRRRLGESVWHWDKKEVNHALKQAGNFVVQSVAASICKRAMIKLHQEGFNIVNQVHDSVTCLASTELNSCTPSTDASLVYMSMIMKEVVKLSIPLEVDGKILTTFKE